MAKRTKIEDPPRNPDHLVVQQRGSKSDDQIATELALSPVVGNALLARELMKREFPGSDATKAVALVLRSARRATKGDLSELALILMSQAVAYNALQAELIQKALRLMDVNPTSAESYLGLAIRVQNQVRCTAETIQKLVEMPPENPKNEIFEGTSNGREHETVEPRAPRQARRGNTALATLG